MEKGLDLLRRLGGVTYIASPYTHPAESIREVRYRGAMRLTAFLLNHSIWAYSPIQHCHEMAKVHALPTDALAWQQYNEAFIRSFSSCCVLCLEGWEKSAGVKMEIEFARLLSKPIFMVKEYENSFEIKMDNAAHFLMKD